jgi:hypothetical protein
MVLHYWFPSVCPRCKELFVNAVRADLLFAVGVMAAGFCLALAGIPLLAAVAIILLLLPTRAFLVKPLRYGDFKPYGKRGWLENVVIFGLLPLALVTGVVLVALLLGILK